jgi:CDP-glucose 4,6-dehydratase
MENMVKKTVSGGKFWKNKRVLVTGGAGFVGSWLSAALVAEGARVVSLDIKPKMPTLGEPRDRMLKKCVFVRGDVRNATLLSRLFAKHKFNTVFHLAAEALVGEVLADPALAFDTNIMGTVRVLEEVRKHRGVHVVVASSDKAYGAHKNLPYKEHFPLLGESHPYDCSKSCTDLVARMYARVYKLSVAVIRCGNIYGGGDLNFSRLIPGTIHEFLHERPIKIRSNGLYRRDYVYIKDVVSAYFSLAEHLNRDKGVGEAFNFGNDKPLRVLEVVGAITKLMRKTHLKPVIVNDAQNEILHQYLDSSKSRRVLGWKPQYKIEKGLAETIKWYKGYFL